MTDQNQTHFAVIWMQGLSMPTMRPVARVIHKGEPDEKYLTGVSPHGSVLYSRKSGLADYLALSSRKDAETVVDLIKSIYGGGQTVAVIEVSDDDAKDQKWLDSHLPAWAWHKKYNAVEASIIGRDLKRLSAAK